MAAICEAQWIKPVHLRTPGQKKGRRWGQGNNSRSPDAALSSNAFGNTGWQNVCQYMRSVGDAGSSTEPVTVRRWTRVLLHAPTAKQEIMGSREVMVHWIAAAWCS